MKLALLVAVITLAAGVSFAQQSVDFRVNMSVQMLKGNFNAAEDTVFVGGTFNGWGGSTDIMTDPDHDSIYTVTLNPGNPGDTLLFKYRFADVSAGAGNFVWESDPNRSYVVPAGASVYEDFFNRDSAYYPAVDIAMTFSVNMELERLSGRFDPATDTVSVNGTFNGWSPKTSILLPNGLNPDLYEGTFTIHAAQKEKINFKFWYTDNNWESVSDRAYTFTGSDVGGGSASFSASFNDGTLDNVLNQSCAMKFTVRTQGAISAISAAPFPAINSVSICGSALPLQWPGGGWPASDSIRAIKMYDDGTHGDAVGGDGVFTVTLTVPAYTVLNVQYKYGMNFGDNANNGGGNDNEAGVGDNHNLVMTKHLSSATAVDTFGRMGVTSLQDPTGVKETGVLPTVYNLKQNYPNPFNPTTNIVYQLPQAADVTLVVYNLFGQEVGTLVNQHQQGGEYVVDFKANTLASGIYYYRLTAGKFVDVKKMLLVK